MLIILTFILNAGLNFLLGLCVAAALGPGAYGRFSIAFTAATLTSTLVFDWLRLSATRFYNEQTRASAPELRATLNAGYLAGSLSSRRPRRRGFAARPGFRHGPDHGRRRRSFRHRQRIFRILRAPCCARAFIISATAAWSS